MIKASFKSSKLRNLTVLMPLTVAALFLAGCSANEVNEAYVSELPTTTVVQEYVAEDVEEVLENEVIVDESESVDGIEEAVNVYESVSDVVAEIVEAIEEIVAPESAVETPAPVNTPEPVSTPQVDATMQRAQSLGLTQATVLNIVDGDTLDVNVDGRNERIRIIGIDTPERGEAGFNEATNFARNNMPVGATVWLQSEGNNRDRFDRLRRHVWLNVPGSLSDNNYRNRYHFGQLLLNNGHAVIFGSGNNNAASASATPQPAAPPVPTTSQNADNCLVHGNINSDIYHMPGQTWHGRLNPNNLRCFASSEEAVAAGFRRARN